MKRFTNESKKYECRIKKCYAEDWMFELYGKYVNKANICETCPFLEAISHLAELEDKENERS